jgi:hypothetical protein
MFYDLEQDERTAVKTAVALAASRYRDTIGKFVQGKADRLSIVGDQVDRIARECAEAAKADPDEVKRLFNQYVAELAVSEPDRQNVTDTAEYNNSDEVPQPEQKDKPGVRDDIKGTEAVLDDNPAEHLDMDADSSLTDGESEVKVSLLTPVLVVVQGIGDQKFVQAVVLGSRRTNTVVKRIRR